MRSEAAILWKVGDEWSVEPIELDPPGPNEVLVELHAGVNIRGVLDLAR